MAIEIEWVDSTSPQATGNKIYRDDVEIADIANGVQFYSDGTVAEGTEYKYEVQAHDGAGDETTQEVEGENMDYITTASAYDADAQAYIDAVAVMTTPQKDAVNDLFLGLKANGTFTKYNAFYPMVGGTAAAHKWNAKNPLDTDEAHRLTYNGTIIHDANGMKGDGTTGWADTHFSAYWSGEWTDQGDFVNGGIGVYSNSDDSGSYDIGHDQPNITVRTQLQLSNGTNSYGALSSGYFLSGDGSNKKQVALNSVSGTVSQFQNGVKGGASGTQSGAALSATYFALLASRGDGDTTPINYSARRQAFAWIAENMTDADIIADAAVIETFNLALGRSHTQI